MKWLAIAAVMVSVTACSGGSGGSGPTAPTPAANASIGGSYNLTVTASSSCSANLPPGSRSLTYIADVVQTGTAVQVTLLAHVIWSSVTVIGTVSGQTVTFSNFTFSELTTDGGVALSSTGTASVAANGSITGTLNGGYHTATGANCSATNHQFQMVKR